MSDYIPIDIQIQILKKLPTKSVIQLRCVSKRWKSLIESSNFIADYNTSSSYAQPQHLLIRYADQASEEIYVSIVDDDHIIPKNKFSPTLPPSVNLLMGSVFVGTSDGLVCLFGYYRNQLETDMRTLVLWNPSIRKSVDIVVPNDDYVLGFGVCPGTSDPKIVKIGSHWKVEVFTLSSMVWRSLTVSDKSFRFNCYYHRPQVIVGGAIYWLAVRDREFHFVISFDLLTEEFKEIHLPDKLAFHDPMELFLCKHREDSVVVVKGGIMLMKYEVWIMQNQVFTNLFTLNAPYELFSFPTFPLEFRRNGEIVIAIDIGATLGAKVTLAVYEPFSKHLTDLGITGCSVFVSSYTEALTLLDRSFSHRK